MSVSYAGINLPTITRELTERIERYISTQDLYPWDFSLPGQGRLGFTHAAERWRTRPPRLGRLSWPSGASRWATAFFVVDSTSLASIREVVYAGGKYTPSNLFITDDDEDATAGITASMYMLPARPLIGVAPGDLWLLVLVDQRYFWWQARSGNLSVADGTSWASLYTTLGNLLPGRPSITPDTISSDYQTAPAWFSATDEHIPPLLDSVAKCVGQQIVCGLDGTIHAYGYTSSRSIQQSNLAEELDTLAGGELSLAAGGDTPGLLPQAVQVDFPQVQNGGYSGKVSSSTQALSSLGILSGVQTNADTRVLFHPFSAQLAAGGSWTNQTACQTLAKAYATSYYQSLTSAEDRVLAGIVDWTPEGLEDWIEWTWTAEMASTRIQRLARLTEDMPSLPSSSPVLPVLVAVTAAAPQTVTLAGGGTVQAFQANTYTYSGGGISLSGSAWCLYTNSMYPPLNPTLAEQVDTAQGGTAIYAVTSPAKIFAYNSGNFVITSGVPISGWMGDCTIAATAAPAPTMGGFSGYSVFGSTITLSSDGTSPADPSENGSLLLKGWFGKITAAPLGQKIPDATTALVLSGGDHPAFGIETGAGSTYQLSLGQDGGIVSYDPSTGHEMSYSLTGGIITNIADNGPVTLPAPTTIDGGTWT